MYLTYMCINAHTHIHLYIYIHTNIHLYAYIYIFYLSPMITSIAIFMFPTAEHKEDCREQQP